MYTMYCIYMSYIGRLCRFPICTNMQPYQQMQQIHSVHQVLQKNTIENVMKTNVQHKLIHHWDQICAVMYSWEMRSNHFQFQIHGKLQNNTTCCPKVLKTHCCTGFISINTHALIHCLKGQFTPKSKTQISPLTCRAIYQSRQFWCELSSFGDIGRRDFCLLSNIMGINCAHSSKQIHLKNTSVMSLSIIHDPVTQNNSQTLL